MGKEPIERQDLNSLPDGIDLSSSPEDIEKAILSRDKEQSIPDSVPVFFALPAALCRQSALSKANDRIPEHSF